MDNRDARLRKALIKQHQIIFDYDTKKIRDEYCEYISCPVCDSVEKTTAFTKDWFNFSKCTNCGMVYLNPRLSETATYQFYESEWSHIYNEEKFQADTSSSQLDDKINCANLLLIDRLKHGKGELLEVGIGKGYFLKQAQEAGYDVHGVELNKNNCDTAVKLLGSRARVFNMDLFAARFEANRFDVIYMRDVLEHVPNPRKLLQEFSRIAKRDCVVFIEVPNIDGWIYKLVKERHVCVFGFEHLNYWSPKTLSASLNSCGFDVIDVLHESLDFKMTYILSYLFEANFASINQHEVKGLLALFVRIVRKLISMPPLNVIDDLLPAFADKSRHGSVIRVVAVKR